MRDERKEAMMLLNGDHKTPNEALYDRIQGVYGEPYKTKFFEGLREAVLEFGNKVVFNDTYILYLTGKP